MRIDTDGCSGMRSLSACEGKKLIRGSRRNGNRWRGRIESNSAAAATTRDESHPRSWHKPRRRKRRRGNKKTTAVAGPRYSYYTDIMCTLITPTLCVMRCDLCHFGVPIPAYDISREDPREPSPFSFLLNHVSSHVPSSA